MLLYLKSTCFGASLKGIFIADLGINGICGTRSVEKCSLRAISLSPLPVRLCTNFDHEEYYLPTFLQNGRLYNGSGSF